MKRYLLVISTYVILFSSFNALSTENYETALYDFFKVIDPNGAHTQKFKGLAKKTNVPKQFQEELQSCFDNDSSTYSITPVPL